MFLPQRPPYEIRSGRSLQPIKKRESPFQLTRFHSPLLSSRIRADPAGCHLPPHPLPENGCLVLRPDPISSSLNDFCEGFGEFTDDEPGATGRISLR
jgi:hypothetical protein